MQYKKLYKQKEIDEFAGHVQIKLPWIVEVPSCGLIVERITVGRSFSQLFKVEQKENCVVKMRRSRFSVSLAASGIQGNSRIDSIDNNYSTFGEL